MENFVKFVGEIEQNFFAESCAPATFYLANKVWWNWPQMYLLAPHSIKESICDWELFPSPLLQLITVQECDSLHDDAQLDEAEEEEADARHQPRLNGS